MSTGIGQGAYIGLVLQRNNFGLADASAGSTHDYQQYYYLHVATIGLVRNSMLFIKNQGGNKILTGSCKLHPCPNHVSQSPAVQSLYQKMYMKISLQPCSPVCLSILRLWTGALI